MVASLQDWKPKIDVDRTTEMAVPVSLLGKYSMENCHFIHRVMGRTIFLLSMATSGMGLTTRIFLHYLKYFLQLYLFKITQPRNQQQKVLENEKIVTFVCFHKWLFLWWDKSFISFFLPFLDCICLLCLKLPIKRSSISTAGQKGQKKPQQTIQVSSQMLFNWIVGYNFTFISSTCFRFFCLSFKKYSPLANSLSICVRQVPRSFR